MTKQLDKAIVAAKAQDWVKCLSALLVGWRMHKAPELAELIERVGERVPAAPIASGGIHEAIRLRIESATDADVTTILRVVLREVRTAPHAYGHVIRLATKRDPDPRIAAALAQLVEKAPFKRTEGALYGDVITALDAIDDPRFRQVILDGWARVEPRMRRLRRDKKDAEVLARIAAAVTKRRALGRKPETTKAVAAIASLLDAKTPTQKKQSGDTNALLRAIYDDPLDTALRLVYADALIEAGNPRGEFITLQCNRGDTEPSKRERELLKQYDRTWLGAIEPIVLKSGVAYRRGFLARAREATKLVAQNTLLSSPEWSTIEELELTVLWGDEALAFVCDPRWKALRAVAGLTCDDAIALGERTEPLPWTSLALRSGWWNDRIARVDTLPDLVTLDIASVREPLPAVRSLAKSRLARSLRRLRFSVVPYIGATAKVVAAARDAGITEVELSDDDGEHVVRIVGDRAIAIAYAAPFRRLVHVCDRMPNPISAIELVVPPRTKIPDGDWAWFTTIVKSRGAAVPPRP